MRLSFVVSIFSVILLAGCQQSPTKIVSQHERSARSGFLKQNEVIDQRKLSKDVLVLDTRPRLAYSLAHIEGSFLLDSDEFFNTSGRFKGQPKADTDAILRRLSQIGLDPETTVLVIGEGPKGTGKEGRILWLLKGLGVHKIEVVAFDGIQNRRVINGEPAINLTSKPAWTVQLSPDRIASTKEVKDFASGKLVREGKRVHLIDVRSEKEYFKKLGFGEGYETPNLNGINIPWTEFLRDDGRVAFDIHSRLSDVGVRPTDRVIVISNQGVRSSLVAYALEVMGYRNVGNAVGGIESLIE